jgi:hypothetical protein
MKLFDDIEHKGKEPKFYSESDFEYLNRIGRSDAQKIREVLEDWFSHYPDGNDKADLRGRFRDKRHIQHQSAFFELLIHEILLRLEYNVNIHPQNDDTIDRRPDFIAFSEGKDDFIIEAVLATEESESDMSAQSRKDVVYDTINRLDSPNFYIGMNLRGDPKTPPPGKKIREFLESQLLLLDHKNIVERFKKDGLKGVPKWYFEHEGWEIIFYPIPKDEKSKGQQGVRPIGVFFQGFFQANPVEAIRSSILSKAKAYGKLNLPYVIAVNSLERHIDNAEIMDALFGQSKFTVSKLKDGGVKTKEERSLDGVWTSNSGPRNTQVSAVLMFLRVTPWDIARCNVRLWHNPYASIPYISALTRLPQAVSNDQQKMDLVNGESLSSILSLPIDWPKEE